MTFSYLLQRDRANDFAELSDGSDVQRDAYRQHR
jgi:hypothetical protein